MRGSHSNVEEKKTLCKRHVSMSERWFVWVSCEHTTAGHEDSLGRIFTICFGVLGRPHFDARNDLGGRLFDCALVGSNDKAPKTTHQCVSLIHLKGDVLGVGVVTGVPSLDFLSYAGCTNARDDRRGGDQAKELGGIDVEYRGGRLDPVHTRNIRNAVALEGEVHGKRCLAGA